MMGFADMHFTSLPTWHTLPAESRAAITAEFYGFTKGCPSAARIAVDAVLG